MKTAVSTKHSLLIVLFKTRHVHLASKDRDSIPLKLPECYKILKYLQVTLNVWDLLYNDL